MKILILGGAGMLGHKLFQRLRPRYPETVCTIRGSLQGSALERVTLFARGGVIENIEASKYSCLARVIAEQKPSLVINCIGVVKQRAAAAHSLPSIQINALLPHRLAETCESNGVRLIHFSTDCVFSGDRGSYAEDDPSDARDLYGRSKFLGEVTTGNALTLRTSIIGRELTNHESLLEWLLRQKGKSIEGYIHALYSGVTTNHLARVLEEIISNRPELRGLYQVTAPTISKFDLLCQLRDAYKLNIEIIPNPDFHCDRSLKGEKFARATGITAPSWPELVRELATDDTPYSEWK
jgi:dTDP-4-dehydrorhamnose reductase